MPPSRDRRDLLLGSPVFPGSPPDDRLATRADAPAPAPIGWRVTIQNRGVVNHAFKTAAVCVPEPDALALGLAAIAGLGLRARRAAAPTRRQAHADREPLRESVCGPAETSESDAAELRQSHA